MCYSGFDGCSQQIGIAPGTAVNVHMPRSKGTRWVGWDGGDAVANEWFILGGIGDVDVKILQAMSLWNVGNVLGCNGGDRVSRFGLVTLANCQVANSAVFMATCWGGFDVVQHRWPKICTANYP